MRMLLLLTLLATPAVGGPLERAEELIDARSVEEAIRLLDDYIRQTPTSGRAHLLRSTARFLTDDAEGGGSDLDRALALDPTLKQAWLNRGGLALATHDYDMALQAFQHARDLAPEDPDSLLNLGVVHLLSGELGTANQEFSAYLDAKGDAADASYLVATNYALAGYNGLALQHLGTAIRLDERVRLQARTDPNFGPMAEDPAYQELLLVDSFRPTPGSHTASREYEARYDPADPIVVRAVLDALQYSQETFDPRVEITPEWSLLWGEMRIRISPVGPDRCRVDLTAPPERFTPDQWKARSRRLLDGIWGQLQRRRRP